MGKLINGEKDIGILIRDGWRKTEGNS